MAQSYGFGKSLAKALYRETARFPDSEKWGLTSQLRRNGVAIPSNIAEGYGRQSPRDYLRFLRIARGALFEMETQLLIAREIGYLGAAAFTDLQSAIQEVGRLLGGLIRSVDTS